MRKLRGTSHVRCLSGVYSIFAPQLAGLKYNLTCHSLLEGRSSTICLSNAQLLSSSFRAKYWEYRLLWLERQEVKIVSRIRSLAFPIRSLKEHIQTTKIRLKTRLDLIISNLEQLVTARCLKPAGEWYSYFSHAGSEQLVSPRLQAVNTLPFLSYIHVINIPLWFWRRSNFEGTHYIQVDHRNSC